MSVYFVQSGEGGRIKIGFSPYPNRRIAYLRRFSGPDLTVLAVIEGERRLENYVHQHLGANRAHDEWFEPTPQVLEVAQRAAKLPQDLGSLREFHTATFTVEEVKLLSNQPGMIGRAARDLLDFPYHYTISVLAGLLRLLGNEKLSSR